MSDPDSNSESRLKPLPYHYAVCDLLQKQATDTWKWFEENRAGNQYEDDLRFELLKSAYRVTPDSDPELYRIATEVAKTLALDVPITIYQAQNPKGLNASLEYIPSHAHIVLHGDISTFLEESEVRALFGHELSHLALWNGWSGDFLVADQLLSALSMDPNADVANFQTIRRFGLYTEVFCDRGALLACQTELDVISMLLKVQTGSSKVDAKQYLEQANEIFERESAVTKEVTHPELFIRSRAIALWKAEPKRCETEIETMISGPIELESMDLVQQSMVAKQTRQLIQWLLSHPWMSTELTRAHAKRFFDGEQFETISTEDGPPICVEISEDSLRSFFCYVLLDFATADRDLEDAPLALALIASEFLGIKSAFMEIAKKALRLRKSQMVKVDKEKQSLLPAAKGDGSP